jgi:hypothetical protein
VFAGAVFAFDGCDLQMGRGHFGLHDKLAPGSTDAHDLNKGLSLRFNEGEP